jgi:hypothetical protein
MIFTGATTGILNTTQIHGEITTEVFSIGRSQEQRL